MPRVKIDYIVSFSSEDPEHPANNLLHKEVSKRKWLCLKGETSCSVVLQLAKAVKISGVHIGAYHAALVEVLVARSETSSDQYQVLVPSSVLVTREESRRGEGVSRVRSFAAEQLSEPARDQRWDRVRVVCSQPYNKHCKYGLSFVHIDEAESAGAGAAVPPRLLAFDTFSSDEDEFKPGELFAKHLQKHSAETTATPTLNTGAQIRQATSQALKNISESSTKLTKATISKPSNKRDRTPAERVEDTDRNRPVATLRRDKTPTSCDRALASRDETPESRDPSRAATDTPPRTETLQHRPHTHQNDQRSSTHKTDGQERKRKRSNSQEDSPGEVSSEPHTLLSGAVLVLSGYENPRRAALRNTALALGARVARDWGPGCTHLICAFPSTPKLRALRASERRGAPPTPAPRGEWLEQVSARRRRLPWRWFAAEPALLRPEPALLRPEPALLRPEPALLRPEPALLRPEPALLRPEPALLRPEPPSRPQPAAVTTHIESPRNMHDDDQDTEGDTDEEIEKVLQKQKKRRATDVGSRSARTTPDTSESAADGASTEEEAAAPACARLAGALPPLLAGRAFRVRAASPLRARLVRYVRAYAGDVLEVTTTKHYSLLAGRAFRVRAASPLRARLVRYVRAYAGDVLEVTTTKHYSLLAGRAFRVRAASPLRARLVRYVRAYAGDVLEVTTTKHYSLLAGRAFRVRAASPLRARLVRYVRAYAGDVLEVTTTKHYSLLAGRAFRVRAASPLRARLVRYVRAYAGDVLEVTTTKHYSLLAGRAFRVRAASPLRARLVRYVRAYARDVLEVTTTKHYSLLAGRAFRVRAASPLRARLVRYVRAYAGDVLEVTTTKHYSLLAGRAFRVRAASPLRARLVRYVRAYAGDVLEEGTFDEDVEVDYVLCASPSRAGAGGARVTPAWLARVLAAGALLPPRA